VTPGRPGRFGSRLGRLLSSAGGAVTVQFVTAGGSLVVQALAARSLGAHGYGAYALFVSVLVMITAVQTSFVGDTLTVFDRFEPRIRGALLLSVAGTVAGGALVGTVVAVALGVTGPAGVAMFALLVALWLLNETGRRIFTARTEFWRLAANDCCYLVITFATLGGALALGTSASVELLLGAMCAGCVGSILLALLRLPKEELAPAPLRGGALREVLGFAWWRSIQAAIRPSALLAARVLIVAFSSTAVLAGIEAARLLLAPALTFVNGAGSFLLGDLAKAEREGRPMRTRQVLRASAILGAVALVVSAAGILLAGTLGPVVTGGSFEVDGTALIGWGVYAVCVACTLPLAVLATVRKLSQTVFLIRGAEALTGLAALAVLLVVDRGNAVYAPYCLGIGGLVSSALLWRMLRRGDPDQRGGRAGSDEVTSSPASSGPSKPLEEETLATGTGTAGRP
jgi:O-antigen/teichoic acid export membrane protein